METYCSHNEDRLLFEFFKEIDKESTGYYVDLGANDGITGSNSYLLEQQGWKGILIEPNPALQNILKEKRSGEVIPYLVSNDERELEFHLVDGPSNLHGLSRIDADEHFFKHVEKHGGTVKKVPLSCHPLTKILEENKVAKDFDFLSIDVEGHELNVLQTLDFDKFSPKIIMLEDNSKGANKGPLNYLKEFGYTRVNRTGVNDWYTRDFKGHFFFRRLKSNFTFIRWDLKRTFYKLINKEYDTGLV